MLICLFRTLSTSECSSIYTRIYDNISIDAENMCAVSADGGGDLCDGDRGAGLVVPHCEDG